MSSLWPRIEPLLANVQKPARYIGCEDGAQQPAHSPGRVAWLLVYPDAYEVGLPNQGLQILYEILNERDDALAERAYSPWVDMESLMRQRGVPLFSVDIHRPAQVFDLLAFNLHEGKTLLKGRSKVGVKVYDMKKGGELVYEAAPKEIGWPENGARHVTENEANFRTVFIGMLAERIARDFYAVELATNFSNDARHLAN